MIDLHLHTHYSDGTLSPEEIVLLAKKNGVDTIAITDHDGMGGISEGLEAGKKWGVQVIPGIELSTEDEYGGYMHILGYGFDIHNEELKREIAVIREKRKERNQKLLAALNEIGCQITQEDLQLREGQDYVGKPVFAMALMKKGYISSPKEAFQEGKFMRAPQVRRIHREKIQTKRAIELIQDAGGIPVLAHPLKIAYLGRGEEGGDFFARLERLIARLKEQGLCGMECYYSKHLLYETERLVQLAEENDLIITAGSDFHGPEFDENLTIGSIPTDPKFNKDRIIKQIQDGIFCRKMV
ncbi:PHP domain-containing protein [Sinanaerobacter chloroacetimidivorans]|jgi:predicted metal-dependent phosphoesterase TrpH|uniref:PHP domain-containing protein n=1 Tax=Sinanaerobacter chloroacetimidivorans TaxID=2818044 RepID=A0A8J8B2R2_9FIRM|nr:PHP domain-containing protein [Sinanaerobacter chloroacetimidivorans]MBR0597505.1 PHP domain-containing protein [Sinanaerobacter chloroacetimidivorans]